MAAKLKKGDKVIVLTGKDKGKEGVIASVSPSTGKAIVTGVNQAIRHTKQSQASQGGRVPTDMPIQLSNLAIVDPKEGGATRVGFKMEGDKKVRFAKKSGALIDG
ncbi:50S ribosomal protein L24 [Amylibacter kogurei]|uniref:Large ribosomal subunit protein uL24 n=1 Tax=Paramylibacter kogurei TaxID=1889778 RepID=A0A2G5K2Z1_9RHOB|nr:50S ribosomal protein L24 [Amylibacter kogurei]PIB23898.1 50S ribosomal protein L24 [Amylibacter kogurei]